MSDHLHLRATDEALWITNEDGTKREIIVRAIHTISPNQTILANNINGLPDRGDVILVHGDQALGEVVGFEELQPPPHGGKAINILIRNYPRKQPPYVWIILAAWIKAGTPRGSYGAERLQPNLN